jgi:hypothetical protein
MVPDGLFVHFFIFPVYLPGRAKMTILGPVLRKNPALSRDGSVDYGSKSVGGVQRKSLEDGRLEVGSYRLSLEFLNSFAAVH